jgi:diacylglycerol kinase
MDRIIQMIINAVMRQVINRGVKTGIDYATRGGKPVDQMTPEERQQSQSAKDMAKRARQAANLAKRLGR